MSPGPLSLSADLVRLRDEGYEATLSPSGGFLLVGHVPYVMPAAGVAYGTLVSKLELAGLSTVNPVQDHSVYFIGETPSDRFGRPLGRVIAATQQFELESGLIAQHSFSSRPADGSKYPDYFVKMTTYTEMLAGQARALDPEATAQTYRILPETDADSPFVYPDTASSRAGIGVISDPDFAVK